METGNWKLETQTEFLESSFHPPAWRIPLFQFPVLNFQFPNWVRLRVICGTRRGSLPLLPSGPGGVHEHPLHRARSLICRPFTITITLAEFNCSTHRVARTVASRRTFSRGGVHPRLAGLVSFAR